MDIASNAQAADGAQPEARLAEINATDGPSVEKISDAKQSQQKSHVMQDITTPPPAYQIKQRKHFWQIWRLKHVPPPPATLEEAPIIPLADANFLQELLYTWISPLMKLGAARPLQATDLWAMDESRTAAVQAEHINRAYARQQAKAKAFNAKLDDRQVRPSWFKRTLWTLSRKDSQVAREEWYARARRRPSLARAILRAGGPRFWQGGAFKVIGDLAQLFGPLVSRNLIEFAQQKSRARSQGLPEPNIGRGIGDAIGLLLLTIMASVWQHAFFYRSMSTGAMIRAGLTRIIFDKSLVLSQEARLKINNGKLLAHLSNDVSRLDLALQWLHALWTAPIQIIVCTVLLVLQIGWSALIGIALFILLIPLQSKIMGFSISVRKKSMVYTDARTRTLQELLSSFAILKYFVFEHAYLKRIANIRGKELVGVWKISLVKAGNQALALSLPVLSAVVSIVVYIGVGNDLNPATVFTAISLFQLLRQPLMFLPRALSAAADAVNAVERLEHLFEAETQAPSRTIESGQDLAIRMENASFTWLAAAPEKIEKKSKAQKQKSQNEAGAGTASPISAEPFSISGLNLRVAKGSLVAVVGAVGSGKSSILSGLIGEMKHLSGHVSFGGKISYCPQDAFIQNCTLRDNVLFGQPFDEERYWQVLSDASLIQDCLLLPDGDLTEIGEKGITISGGQKQRINVARCLYHQSDIYIYDDPLSALDAHVGQAIFDNAMLKAVQAGKTVLLVTHALHILPFADYIYTIDKGHVVEEGTYEALYLKKGQFAKLMEEYGGASKAEDEVAEDVEETAVAGISKEQADVQQRKAYDKSQAKLAAGSGRLEGRLIQGEKRNTGSVKKHVYTQYFGAGRGWITLPLIIGCAACMQGAQALAGVWIVFWQSDEFEQTRGFYMGMYAAIGILQALFTFGMGASISLLTYFASANLHAKSISKIFFAPSSWFSSVPTGRILSVFGKDCDVLDSLLADSLRMSLMIFGNVISSVALVSVYFPYFLIAIFVVFWGYLYFWQYYRASSREIKRLDSILRSLLYGHFTETLSGLATIRAYGETERFRQENASYIDLENRAYFLTSVNQRWLSIRVDFFGALLIFAVALMCAIGVNTISAAEVGLVLAFSVSLTQALGMTARQLAETENNMNAVERLSYYSGPDLPQEAPQEIPETQPPTDWPQHGEICMEAVTMAYRPNLPPVLKQITAHIKAGEKIGIVGRTGAGKSSIMAALFRMVELSSGRIVIDGIDISTVGLAALRSKLAIIPQDPQLFSGTFRTNLDPFSQYDDARLNDALKRAYLIEDTARSSAEKLEEPTEKTHEQDHNRFSLDSVVEDGGENLSNGQRSLLSLARALVKDSQIIVLDEATASVDLHTDAKIQQTITTEFAHKTLLCIAHRLRTILSYDRVLVLDQGKVLELDTPLELFRREGGTFSKMCTASSITEADIMKAQAQ